MKQINFSYSDENKTKSIIINYGDGNELVLNIEEECLEKISDLNNFILKEIGKDEEIEFVFKENNENDFIKKMIESIINIYKNEYKIIKENINIINK